MGWYQVWGKRAFDLLLGVPIAIVSLPLLIVLWALVLILLGSPVLFHQERPGKNARVFRMVKFRTMSNERDAAGNLLPDSERLTSLGKFLRSTSMDEIPALWNVLKGDMSLVGPRPLLVDYLPFYTAREGLRHSVPPGITGLAQVSGRNNLPWEERLETDVRYCERCSIGMDLRILSLTILRVIRRSDVLVVPSETQQRLDHERRS